MDVVMIVINSQGWSVWDVMTGRAALDTCRCWLEGKGRWAGWAAHLEAVEILRFEVIGGAAAPVHDVLVLALAAQLAVPVGDAQVVVYHGVTVGAVLQDSVEEGLRRKEGPGFRPHPASFEWAGLGVLPRGHLTVKGLSCKLSCSLYKRSHSGQARAPWKFCPW